MAYEAVRLSILELDLAMSKVETDLATVLNNVYVQNEALRQAEQQELINKAAIELIFLDVDDVRECLARQMNDQRIERLVLEVFC